MSHIPKLSIQLVEEEEKISEKFQLMGIKELEIISGTYLLPSTYYPYPLFSYFLLFLCNKIKT